MHRGTSRCFQVQTLPVQQNSFKPGVKMDTAFSFKFWKLHIQFFGNGSVEIHMSLHKV